MENASKNYPKVEDQVFMDEQTPQMCLALMQSMVDACYYGKAGCRVCQDLERRIEAASHSSQTVVKPVESEVLVEQERSRVVKQQLLLCAQAYYFSQRPASSMSIDSVTPNAPEGGSKSTAAATAAAGASGTATAADSDDRGGGRRGNRTTDSRISLLDDLRESRRSYADNVDGDRNISLSYGLHHLIRDIDLLHNHRLVFQRLSQMQQRSLLAQISCKGTLWKETENDARLLRIEQELNDLLAKEDTARQVTERQSSVGGMTSASKKSSHDHGGLLL